MLTLPRFLQPTYWRRRAPHPLAMLRARLTTLLALVALAFITPSPLTAAGEFGLLAVIEPGDDAQAPSTLRLVSADGSSSQTITLPVPIGMLPDEALAPDGTHLAYYSGGVNLPDQPEQNDLTLHIVRLDEGAAVEVRTIDLLPPSFPDNIAQNARLLLQRDPALGDLEDLTEAVWWAFAYSLDHFAWSPDGTQLAFSAATDGPSSDLYVYSTTADEVTRLTDGIEQIDGIRWSPDGALIWHSSISYGLCQTCDGGRYAAAADGSGVVVQPGDDVDRFLGWVDDGAYLSTDQANGPGDFALSRVDIAAGTSTMLWPGTHQAFVYDPLANRLGVVGTVAPTYSPDSHVFVVDLATDGRVEYATAEEAIAAEPWLAPLAAPNQHPCARPGVRVYPCNDTHFDPLSPDGAYVVSADGAVLRTDDETEVLGADATGAGAQILWRPDSAGYFTVQAKNVHYRDLPTGVVKPVSDNAAIVRWLPGADAPATSAPALPTATPTGALRVVPPPPPPAPTPTAQPMPTAEIDRPMRQRVLLDDAPSTAHELRAAQAQQLGTVATDILAGDVPLTSPDDGLPLLLAREAVRTTHEAYLNVITDPYVAPEAAAALEASLAAAPAWLGVFPNGGDLPSPHSLALHPDGREIAVGYGDGTVRLWEIASGTLIRTLVSSDTSVTYLTYNADGTRLAAVDQAGIVRVWSPTEGVRTTSHYGRYQSTSAVAFRPGTGDLAIANGSDPVVIRPPSGAATLLVDEAAEALAYSPDGSRLAVALLPEFLPTQAVPYVEPYVPPQRGIQVVDANRGSLLYTLPDDGATLILAYSPDGETLVSATSTTLRVFDADDGKLRFETSLTDVANGFAFTPDGSRFAMLTRRNGINAWNLTTGENVLNLATDANILAWLAVHPTQPRFISVDVSGRPVYIDGESGEISYPFDTPAASLAVAHPTLPWVVTVGSNRLAVRNFTAQRTELELQGLEAQVTDLAISPDGNWVAATEVSGHVTLWEIYQPTPRWRVQVTEEWLTSVAIAADGRVVAGGQRGLLFLLDPEDGSVLAQAALSGDIKRLAIGAPDDLAVLMAGPSLMRYNLDDLGTGVRQIVFNEEPEGTDIAYSPDGAYLAVTRRHSFTGDASRVEVWSTADGSLVHSLALEAGYSSDAVAFSHDGTLFATGATGNQAITLWAASTGEPVQQLAAPGVMAHSDRLAFGAGDDTLLTTEPFGITHVYSVDPPRALRTFAGHAGSVWDVALHPNGRWALTAGDDASVRIWDWQTGEQVGQFVPQPERVYSVAYSPSGDSALVAGEDGEARLYYADGQSLQLTFTGHEGAIQTAIFRPDGREIATAGMDGSVRVWSANTGAPQWWVEGLPEGVDALAYAPSGDLLAGGAGAGPATTIFIWDGYTGEEVMQLDGHTSYIAALAFSPDGTLLASASWDRTIKIWDAETGDLRATFEGHSEILTDLAFSPDGTLLASLAEDYTLRLWDPMTGMALDTVELPRALPWALAFSPDGHALVTAHADGALRTWLTDPADASIDADLLRAAARVPRATAAFTPIERRDYGIDAFVGAYGLSASGRINLNEEPYVKSLLVLPETPERIIGLTNEGFLIESTNQGEQWHLMARIPITLTVNSLGMPARVDDPLLLATEQGLYRREENGTYSLVHAQPIHAVSYSHTNPDEYWAIMRNGIYKSEDGGQSWGEADANLFPNRLSGPLIMAAPNNNPQFVMGFPADVPALTHWRGSGNGFWEQLVGLPPLPLYLRGPFGMAWDNGNQTLYLGGAQGELWASANAAAPTASEAAATQIEQFGLGVRAVPLALGQGPTLYVTLLTPYGAELVRGEWDGQLWQWTQLHLPIVAMG